MSKRYPGGVIRKTPATPTQASASGVWNMTDVTQAQQTNNWPVANVPNPMSRSLRFRSNATAYLNRTGGNPTNGQKFTLSFWLKRGTLTTSSAQWFVTGGAANNVSLIGFPANSDTLAVYQTDSVGQGQVTTAVLRDPSAWYSVIIAVDTTQASNTDRIKIYINNVQQATSVSGTVTQNSTWGLNSANPLYIGRYSGGSYFDGYLTEVNFVDGQALAPTAFGQYDQFSNWTSKQYTGTYGTNGFYLKFSNNSSTGTLGLDYSGNNNTWTTNNFSVTPSYQYTTLTSGSGTYTVPSNVTSINYLVVAGGGGGSSWGGGGGAGGLLQGTMAVTPGQTIAYSVGAGGAGAGAGNGVSGSNSTFGLLTAIGGGGGTADTTVQNGGSGGGSAYGTSGGPGTSVGLGTVGQGSNGGLSSTSAPYQSGGGGAGAVGGNPSGPNPGGVAGSGGAGLTWVNGSTYAGGGGGAGAVNAGGAWSAGSGGSGGGGAGGVSGAGTAGTANTGGGGGAGGRATNTFYAGGAGGSGVIIIANSTGNSTYDSMTDVPTQWTPYNVTGDVGGIIRGNYCVMNPLKLYSAANFTFADGNLKLTYSSNLTAQAIASMSFGTSGKYYYEVTVIEVAGQNGFIGIMPTSSAFATNTPAIVGYYRSNGNISNFTTGVTAGNSYTTGDIIGIAVDVTSGTVQFYKNNTAQGTTPSYSFSAGTDVTAYLATDNNAGNKYFAVNFGQYAFTYAPPSGYKSLCTTNLPTPTIQQGNLVMDATTYTGNGSSLTVTNAAGFKPDFVWIKNRSSAYDHYLYDSVRGANIKLSSNTTDAEATQSNGLDSFTSSGFTLNGGRLNTNENGAALVGWQWQAGQGTTSSNTAGSITSTVSVNPTAGFSVVTYTGNATASTVGHGLGVAPSFITAKVRSRSGDNWHSYHSALGGTQGILLNATNAASTDSGFWNNTNPSSSVFTVGTYNTFSSQNYVAYCWSEIAGFSKFGSYTGNGSADGTFVYTGFRPKYIMWKRSSGVGDWLIQDTSRSPYNLSDAVLYANYADAEGVGGGYGIDILSNGFKFRTSATYANASGSTYIYMAFAEYPFKSALAR